MGKRIPTKTSSPSWISRAAAATINSPREKDSNAILEDFSPDMEWSGHFRGSPETF
jgi:hypothetical protein